MSNLNSVEFFAGGGGMWSTRKMVAEQIAPTAIIRLRFSSLVVAMARCTVKLQ